MKMPKIFSGKPDDTKVVKVPKTPDTTPEGYINLNGVVLKKAADTSSSAQPMEGFVYHNTALSLIRDIAQVWNINNIPIVYAGSGFGKTEVYEQMTALLGWTLFKVTVNPRTDESDIYGSASINIDQGKVGEDGAVDDRKFKFISSKIWDALSVPDGQVAMLLWDEYLFADPRNLSMFNELIDALKKNGKFKNPVTGEERIVNPDKLKIGVATNKPGGKYYGRNPLGTDQIDRFVRINLPERINEDDAIKRATADLMSTYMDLPEVKRINRDGWMTIEELREVPGIIEIVSQFVVFLRKVEEQEAVFSKDDPQKNGYSERTISRFKDFIRANYMSDHFGSDLLMCAREAARLLVVNKFMGDPTIDLEQDTGPRGQVYHLMLSTLNWTLKTNPDRRSVGSTTKPAETKSTDPGFWKNPKLKSLVDTDLVTGLPAIESAVVRLDLSESKGKTSEQLLTSGNYDYVSDYCKKYDRAEDKVKTTSLDIAFFNPTASRKTDDILKEMDSLGLRPLNAHELYTIGIKYPELQRKNALVSLGSSQVFGRVTLFPCLWGNGSDRGADAFTDFGVWNDFCRFPVARK